MTTVVIKPGMSLEPGDKVEVYYNIQKGGFSIVSMEKPHYGKVVAYAANVLIEDARFCINERKLERIRSTNRKTVYATVKGRYVHADDMADDGFRKGYCNPFKTGRFIDWNSGKELTAAQEVYFYDKFFSYHNDPNYA